jgi:hypothetical protein
MSLAVSPFRVFQSCRASLASRNLSRAAFTGSHTHHRPSRIGTRHYSSNEPSETTPPQGEPDKNGGKAGSAAEVDPCADVKNSLKAKDAEVLDLTVRIINLLLVGISGLPFNIRADYAIYKQTSSTFSVMQQERRNKQKTTQSPDLQATFSRLSTSSP